jgi:hypothetical protein
VARGVRWLAGLPRELIRGEDLSDDEAAAALAALLRSLGSAFRRLAEEFADLSIEVEWRVVPDEVGRAMHARVIFNAGAWELPPLNLHLMGRWTHSIRAGSSGKRSTTLGTPLGQF